jgi:hypothetical protein
MAFDVSFRFGVLPQGPVRFQPRGGYFRRKMRVLRAGALFLELEMQACAPIFTHVPPLWADCLAKEQEIFDMFATVARWSHNTLLLAMALLTAALVVFAI